MLLSVVIPTFNEAPNIMELVRRVTDVAARMARDGVQTEVIFVDDSRDATPDVIRGVAANAPIPVRLIHRDVHTGGLGGAVVEGIRAAASDVCVVMDGDLQHPPETIPDLVDRYRRGGADLIVASRYVGDGSATGLADKSRVLVSKGSTALTKSMFPIRLKDVSDPMTGFFLVDRRTVDIDTLAPRGFKILLEMLARKTMRVAEVPFSFADRHAGASKASLTQGLHFLIQLAALRFGKMSLFAVIGGLGAIANVLIVWALTHLGMDYIAAAIIAAELTIAANFLLMERFVFQDMKDDASNVWSRFAKSFTFNNAELLIRIPIVAVMVGSGHLTAVVATAITLAIAFFVRFIFHSLVVYAPRKAGARPSRARELVEELDSQAMSPGEL